MIKVSVILAIYNAEEYLKKCLDSLTSQTLQEIEIICVNDGSTDNCPAILEEYAQKDNRIVIINQENQGPGAARNNGLNLVNGKYIAFVDPDDWVEQNTFEKLYSFAQQDNLDLIEFDYNRYYAQSGNTKLRRNKIIKKGIFNWHDCIKYIFSNDFVVWNKFYKSELIKENNIHFSNGYHGEDLIFTIAARLMAKRVSYLKSELYNYNIREGSTVVTCSEHNFEVSYFIADIKTLLIQENVYIILKKYFSKFASGVLCHHYKMLNQNRQQEFLKVAKSTLSNEEYQLLEFRIRTNYTSLLEYIFSLKNDYRRGVKSKVLNILGFKICISRRSCVNG